LQLTLGLRYDAEINTLDNDFTVPWATDATLQAISQLRDFLNTGHRKNDLNNLGPRVAFSWDVFDDQRTFLRGGAGIMYDRITTFMAFNEKVSAGWRTYDFSNPGTTDPDSLRRLVAAGGGTVRPARAAPEHGLHGGIVPVSVRRARGLYRPLLPRHAADDHRRALAACVVRDR